MVSAVVVAKPPPDKPGGGKPKDPPPPGTVFYRYNDHMWTMNTDGSDKTQFGIDYSLVDGYKVFGAVSREQHNGHYWFVRYREIAGETYPDGDQRLEIFAARDDGMEEVQLTDDPNLATQRWAGPPIFDIGDDEVSFGAKRWVEGQEVPVDFGIYSAPLAYDVDGNIAGAGAPQYIWDTGYWYNENTDHYAPNLKTFDWSPDETKIVLADADEAPLELFIADLGTGTDTYLTEGFQPKWSPDGNKIGFLTPVYSSLCTINSDGTDEEVIVPSSTKGKTKYVKYGIDWSPDSNHLLYTWVICHKVDPPNYEKDVYRVGANGDDKTCLTKELDASSRAIAWR
jgi:hypothetical protein